MGRFGIAEFIKHSDLTKIFEHTRSQISVIRENLSKTPNSLLVLEQIDEISNLATTVGDVAASTALLHPSAPWRDVAYSVQDNMDSLYTELNDDPIYYRKVMMMLYSDVYETLTNHQKLYVEFLARDLEKEGSHVSNASKKILSNEIYKALSEWQFNIVNAATRFEFHFSELDLIPTEVRPERRGKVQEERESSVLGIQQLDLLLTYSDSEAVRQRAWSARNSSAPYNEPILQEIVSKRSDFARILGHSSWTEYTLTYQMFETSGSELIDLIQHCLGKTQRKVANEVSILHDLKARHVQESRNDPVSLERWDLPFYMNRYLSELRQAAVPGYTSHYLFENYFTVQNILKGVSIMWQSLFGVDVEVQNVDPSERWTNDLIRLQFSKDGDILGYTYLDLFTRPGKFATTAAKFNIQASVYKKQPCITVLVWNFRKPGDIANALNPSREDLLQAKCTQDELRNFFHEFGHVMHSVLSKTEYQYFSGTRMPLDFAEFPSHLFELFLTDYEFVAQWAQHNNSPISAEHFKTISRTSQAFMGIDHETTLLKSLFDLEIYRGTSVVKAADMVNSQSQTLSGSWFNSALHLGEYGGSYYTYMVGEVLAQVIWERCFQGKLDPDAGQLLYKNVLSQGGNERGDLMISLMLQMITQKSDKPYSYIDVFNLIKEWYDNFDTEDKLDLVDFKRATNWRDLIEKY